MKDKQTAKAVSKYIRISSHKVRRVLDQIRGRSYLEALMLLQFMPYRACGPIWQVLNSAAANAENNNGLNKEDLIVKTVFADQGPVLRRFRPRAQGRGYQIRKPTCHITIILEPNT
uniref:Large ribosomal subunit protein uL22c n=2 Tax=Ecklonia TaxID=105406 RepID=A0A8F0F9X1_9PHAE|nr:50S ribosomal protein L22 [Ecklonia radiata]YP_011005725.1 50S ribosomal protein L22 [Cymathaere triplicata]YP_011006286.1 50S ribosomal protein L22 [Ecklonia cava]YP_011006427.1 50S ribosomal protein L22 [Eisenia bicyclis]QWK43287.1 ribosomal protein L22 [Ecklonia arborea]QWK43571.1 ribosomal protein L22 [Ecklonia radicosa]WAM63431.1 50S ribosomal protein L22 [Ecklonia cava subsp. stolonifera]WAM62729.1 50S ribosomal protein L22 [Cymathaere triplicata]WAM63290.1 50S ribosomal protein L2